MPNDQPTDQDFLNVGKRLALLLAASDMPEDVKESWVVLIPEMSLDQMDRFAKALEENIAGVAGPDLDKLAAEVTEMNAQQDAAKQAVIAKAQASLDEIEALLNTDS